MFEKRADTRLPIHDTLSRRWSGRAFDPVRTVSREQLLVLFEAARWAPSCYGDQPWRYVVCNRAEDESAWGRARDCLTAGNQSWARNAPVLMLVAADTLFTDNGTPNRWGAYDAGAASMSLCVQATEMGLMVHQMGGFDAERARSAFGVPARYTPMAMMAVGYQIAESRIPQDLREREHAPRRRRPLEETFFASEWGQAVRL
ncbi:MAG: nitroreductase family protein [Gammaproteobacteria bacterium]|nr:nitroreductase family protein [Gammaproteobacteria bacterium]